MPTVDLTEQELELICEALDSHEYWQLSQPHERDSGFVFIPGDVEDPEQKMFIDPGEVSEEDKERYEQIQEARALHERLEKLTYKESENVRT